MLSVRTAWFKKESEVSHKNHKTKYFTANSDPKFLIKHSLSMGALKVRLAHSLVLDQRQTRLNLTTNFLWKIMQQGLTSSDFTTATSPQNIKTKETIKKSWILFASRWVHNEITIFAVL